MEKLTSEVRAEESTRNGDSHGSALAPISGSVRDRLLRKILIGWAFLSVLVLGYMFQEARIRSETRSCQENLLKLHGLKDQWALDMSLVQGTAVELTAFADWWDSGPGDHYESMKFELPECPAGSAYDLHSIGISPTCNSGLPGHRYDLAVKSRDMFD